MATTERMPLPLYATNKDEGDLNPSRRDLFSSLMTTAAGGALSLLFPEVAAAGDTAVMSVEGVEMKTFIDPMFAVNVPKRFFALRRSAKGDLPDEKTGKGRRGSSIFSAGDLAKAEVIAVERFPTKVLLEENGIDATGNLNTIPDIGQAAAVANLITLRRDRDKPGVTSTKIVPNSLIISADGKELYFQIKTEIAVQKPELLMEEFGISELFRITAAKASLRSNDGNMMAIFASALEQDWLGPDGAALQESVNSFQAIDQANTMLDGKK